MAFSAHINGYSKDTGKKIFSMEPAWLGTRSLIFDERFVETSLDTSYMDYRARLSIVEMRELYEQFGCFHDDQKKELDDILYKRFNEFSHFVVTVFEWESGY